MNPLELFQLLKNDVLLAYKKQYPYFDGNWKAFSSQDILNLIDLIEEKTRQRVSEKWIYTHLKPEQNAKLPRKDMLDILSQLTGFSSWDEYVFQYKENLVADIENPVKENPKRLVIIIAGTLAFVTLVVFCSHFFTKTESKTIRVKDAFTNKNINSDEVKATVIEGDSETPIKIVNSKIEIPVKKNATVVFESPYYKKKKVIVGESSSDVMLRPDDYAMMLKAFMKSDIKDWRTRKEQLQKILAEELEVMVVLQDNLGFEYFNKKEFSEKLIIPSASLKKMRVIDIQYNNKDEINFIRIIQE